jgi:hypothetical protein
MNLAEYDQKRFAVVVARADGASVLKGTGRLVHDPVVGQCLAISMVDPAAGPIELLLSQADWRGTIEADDRYGCDYRVVLDPRPALS